jgi:predicted flap endonuclease-1-like 5' DNA nuclease
MKFDFESLSSEPLFYMLMHSGAFVCVLGFIFFVIGLLFGYATWGRYKRQTRLLLGEASSLKDEIASLKRKVGDHSILSGPAVAMATETIYMPKKERAIVAETVPAVTEAVIARRDIDLPATAPRPDAPLIAPAAPESALTPESPLAVPVAPPAESATTGITPSASELQPHASPLAAIISAPHVNAVAENGVDAPAAPGGLVLADTLPSLTELLLPALPELEVQPQPELKLEPQSESELDPKLGLIYKTQPENMDNLTEIEGISLVLAQRLHDIGIYTHAQIAAWDEDCVKEFSARLAFKDRICRERWVEQARKLVAAPATV